MNGIRAAAPLAALIVVAGLGAPVTSLVHGQTAAVSAQSPRAVGILSGASRIGVSIRDIPESDMKSGKGVSGVLVEEVSSDSPAEKAGLRKGDVIVEFDGERVRSARQLTRLVQETPAGRTVSAVVLRDGQRTTLTVTPSERGRLSFERFGLDDLNDLHLRVAPRAPTPPTPPTPPSIWRFNGLPDRPGRLGVSLGRLSPQLAEYFGTKHGTLVTSVDDDSAAAGAGLKAGDVITSFNGSPVNDPADVRRGSLDLRDGDEFTVDVMRERKPLTLKGKVERTGRSRSSRTVI